jgi:serine/threonine protein kinase
MEKFRAKEMLDTINQHKLSRLFINIIKGLNDLLQKGINIKYIVPEAILVNFETGDAKIMLQKSTLLKESPLTLLDSFSMIHPSFETLRYLSPETIEHQQPSNSSLSWAIGIMM